VRRTSGISTRGKNSTPPRDPADPPRRRANQRKGHGTYAHARPPIISLISRETGEQRWWVCDHADPHTCAARIAENSPTASTWLDTDAWQRDRGRPPAPATVRQGVQEWARDADGAGRREVHSHTGAGVGAALRTSRRACRGVPKPYWQLYGATYEARVHTKRVTSHLIRRRCVAELAGHTGYT
jgi:transposase